MMSDNVSLLVNEYVNVKFNADISVNTYGKVNEYVNVKFNANTYGKVKMLVSNEH